MRCFRLMAGALALLLAGCGLLRDPIADIERSVGAPVQVTARVSTPDGDVTFYRFVKGAECGEGYSTDGGGGWSSGPCAQQGMLTYNGSSSSQNMTLAYGYVNDPSIVRVVVTYPGGGQAEAKLEQGVWHLVGPGGARPPEVSKVEGFDQAGKVTATAP